MTWGQPDYSNSWGNTNGAWGGSNNNNNNSNNNNNNNNNSYSDGKLPWILNINNLPFFGQSQKFLGKTFWSKKEAGGRQWFTLDFARGPFNDDVDHLNCYWVPALLMMCVATIQILSEMEPPGNKYPGKSGAIWCLKPRTEELTEEEFNYAVEYCQFQTHYYVPPDETLSWRNLNELHRRIGYYHWVEVVLTLQAAIFLVPHLLWVQISKSGGVNYGNFIKEAIRLGKMRLNDAERHKGVRKLSGALLEIYMPQTCAKPRRFFGCHLGRSAGLSIAVIYVALKLIYVLIAVCAFFWLNMFIGDSGGQRWWGWRVMMQWMRNENWQDSNVFPRDSYCKVPIRRLADTLHYTLQCHLRINTYNEKIFLFIWWMFLYTAVATFFNFMFYVGAFMFFPAYSVSAVRQLLTQKEFLGIMRSTKPGDERVIVRFAMEQLGYEGILLFYFIRNNAGAIVARDICAHLFSKYSKIRLRPRRGYPYNDENGQQQQQQDDQQQQDEQGQQKQQDNWRQRENDEEENKKQMMFWYGTVKSDNEDEVSQQKQKKQRRCGFSVPDFRSPSDLLSDENSANGVPHSGKNVPSNSNSSSSNTDNGPFECLRRAFGRKKHVRRNKKKAHHHA